MNRSLALAAGVALAASAAVALAAPADGFDPLRRLGRPATAGPKRSLPIDGSTTLGPITECMTLHFEQVQPKIDVQIPDVHGWPGSSAGIRALAEDTAVHPSIDADDGLEIVPAIAQSSRTLNASDLARVPFGFELKAHEVAKDALAIIVHPDNPLAHVSITGNGSGLGDVPKVFNGTITSWFALGGGCPGDQITIYSRNTNSGTLFSFEDLYLLPAGFNPTPSGLGMAEFPGTVTYVEDARDMVEAVAGDQCAIGYAGLGNIEDGAAAGHVVKTVGVQEGESGGFPVVQPTKATARSGEFPGSRGLFYVTRAEPGVTDERGLFLDFVYSRTGQRIVEATGFVSVYEVGDGPEVLTCPSNG